MEPLPLPETVALFLDDLRRAERSAHTVRAYRTELNHLLACHDARPTGMPRPTAAARRCSGAMGQAQSVGTSYGSDSNCSTVPVIAP